MAKKLIVVFGATGNQGGSVIDAILNSPTASSQFSLRAITRDPSKPSAQALASRGAEVVAADLNDTASLRKALDGAYGVFLVTNYWEKADPEYEYQQGKNVADVAKEVGVQHFVWSSLPDVTKLTNGRLSGVLHFDSKAKVEDHIRSISLPATFWHAGFYMSNISGGMMNPTPDGKLAFSLPMDPSAPIPLIDINRDTGKFIKAIFLNRDKALGKQILGAVSYTTAQEVVDQFNKVKGQDKAVYAQMPDDVFTGYLKSQGIFGIQGSDVVALEMLQNIKLIESPGYYGGEPLEPSHEILEDKLTTWEEFVKQEEKWKDI